MALMRPVILALLIPVVLLPAVSGRPGIAGLPEGTRETAQAPAGPPGQAGPAEDSPAARAEQDSRPVVRLKVTSELRNEDKVFPQVVEGRLISDLADMETFRTVGPDNPGDYLLSVSIRTLDLAQGIAAENPRDPESDGQLRTKDTLNATMNLLLHLEDGAGRSILEQKLSVQASREIEISAARTVELMTQELVDRVAQKVERLLRKKLPRPR